MQYDPSHIDQRMLLLYLLDEISDQGRHDVEAWINYSADNEQTFRELERVWRETGQLNPVPVAVDIDRGWKRMMARMEGETRDERPETRDERRVGAKRRSRFIGRARVKGRSLRVWYGVAAAVLVLFVGSTLLRNWLRSDFEPLVIESFAEVVFDTLGDGSAVALNSDTRILTPETFTDTARVVELDGEAFFSVEEDHSKPFVIQAKLGQIRVLGTEFNVKAYPNEDLEVVVESGLVELAVYDSLGQKTDAVLLADGEKGMISQRDQAVFKISDLEPDEVFWANRKLIFKQTALSKVFELLKKHYEFDFSVSQETILACLLSTSFTNESIEQIMAVIAASFELDLKQNGNRFELIGGGCEDE